jgi:hypothetical protein
VATAATSLRYATLVALAATALVSALIVGPASAGTSETAATSCPSTLEHPFKPWLDPAAYTLAPGGDFEAGGTRWQLSGGSKVVSGNEPFKVHGSADVRSLSIPAGSSALSPVFCAGLGEPTLRLFATGGSLTSWLKVEVLYPTLFGTASQTIAFVPRMGRWAPTLQIPMLGNLVGLTALDGLTTKVQLRLTALGGAGWNVDDVYVDPWKVT